MTENKTVPIRTSSSTSIARRFLETTTIPNMPNGKIVAKTGRDPCLSAPTDLVTPLPPLPAIFTVTVDDGIDVPSMGSEAGDAEQLAPEGTVQVRVNA